MMGRSFPNLRRISGKNAIPRWMLISATYRWSSARNPVRPDGPGQLPPGGGKDLHEAPGVGPGKSLHPEGRLLPDQASHEEGSDPPFPGLRHHDFPVGEGVDGRQKIPVPGSSIPPKLPTQIDPLPGETPLVQLPGQPKKAILPPLGVSIPSQRCARALASHSAPRSRPTEIQAIEPLQPVPKKGRKGKGVRPLTEWQGRRALPEAPRR